MSKNTLTCYSIIHQNEEENEIEPFLQRCIWAQKPHQQVPIQSHPYGHYGEYTIYKCHLTDEDLLCLKLKFSGKMYVIPHVPERNNDETFKLAFGQPYSYSMEAIMERALVKYKILIEQNTVHDSSSS